MHYQRVSNRSGLNVERSGFKISTKNARHALFVLASCVNGCRADGVAGRDRQYRLVRCGKLPVKSCWSEFVPLRRPGLTLRNDFRRELVRVWRLRIVRVSKHQSSGDGIALHFAGAFFSAALFVFRQKMDRSALDRSLQLVAVKIAGKLVSLLLQLQGKCDRSSVKVAGNHPTPGDRSVRATRPVLSILRPSVLCCQKSGHKKQRE